MQAILQSKFPSPIIHDTELVSLESAVVEALWRLNIDYEPWGKVGASKSVESLVASLEDGEIEWDYENASDLLHIHTAVVHILYEKDGQRFELRERHQQFKNKYVNYRRDPDFSGSISKKIKWRKETAIGAAVRGLAEELGPSEKGFLDSRNYRFYSTAPQKEELAPRPSKSCPGLRSMYYRKIFTCQIPEALYQGNMSSWSRTRKHISTGFGYENVKQAPLSSNRERGVFYALTAARMTADAMATPRPSF